MELEHDLITVDVDVNLAAWGLGFGVNFRNKEAVIAIFCFVIIFTFGS